MRIERILSLLFFLTGIIICMVSTTQTWREGEGFTKPNAYPGMLGPGFSKRSYGITNIIGGKTRTWRELTILTCDRAAKVEIAKGLVQEGVCETEVADRLVEECSDKFLPHMDLRCDYYATLWAISEGLQYTTISMSALGLLAGIIMVVPAAPLKAMRTLVLPIGIGTYLALLVGAGVYIYLTDYVFKMLGKTAMYPYPPLAGGAFTHLAGAHFFVIAGLCGIGDFRGTVKDEEPVEEADETNVLTEAGETQETEL